MKTAIKLCVFLALGTVPAFAQKPTTSASTMPGCVIMDGHQSRPCFPEDWDGKNCIGTDCLNACSGWTVHDDVIQCAVWDRYVTSPESVNDPIPADAVAPKYWQQEPYCPTTEYRIRWFVVDEPLSGKMFDARCVPAK